MTTPVHVRIGGGNSVHLADIVTTLDTGARVFIARCGSDGRNRTVRETPKPVTCKRCLTKHLDR